MYQTKRAIIWIWSRMLVKNNKKIINTFSFNWDNVVWKVSFGQTLLELSFSIFSNCTLSFFIFLSSLSLTTCWSLLKWGKDSIARRHIDIWWRRSEMKIYYMIILVTHLRLRPLKLLYYSEIKQNHYIKCSVYIILMNK